MAVSYYPDPRALGIGRYEVVIDISANQPVEFDELDQWAQRQYDADRARHVHQMEREAQAARRRYKKNTLKTSVFFIERRACENRIFRRKETMKKFSALSARNFRRSDRRTGR